MGNGTSVAGCCVGSDLGALSSSGSKNANVHHPSSTFTAVVHPIENNNVSINRNNNNNNHHSNDLDDLGGGADEIFEQGSVYTGGRPAPPPSHAFTQRSPTGIGLNCRNRPVCDIYQDNNVPESKLSFSSSVSSLGSGYEGAVSYEERFPQTKNRI